MKLPRNLPLLVVVLLVSVAAVSAVSAVSAGENLLRNGGFEEGGDGSFAGWASVWPPFLKDPPRFSRLAEEPHGGGSCARIEVSGPGGYSSLTQVVESPPAGAAVARLEGWIRAEKGTAASFILIFFDPEDPARETLVQTPRVADSARWVKTEIESLVPAGTKKWMVRSGIAGKGAAAFDDVSLTWSANRPDAVEAVLAAGRSRYVIAPAAAGRECSITFSVPFPFGGQTPLALRVESDPPDAITRLEARKDRENRPLRVTVRTPERKEPVKLRVETLALLRDRPAADGAGAALASRENIPPDVAVHLRPAPGVEASDGKVLDIAGRLPRVDAKTLLERVAELLRENLKYEGGGNQGAKHCLETGQAVCTGYANVGAAVLAAAAVPARILACTGLEGKLQEHYIVEAWAPGPGWLRLESTMAAFPWPDSMNLVLRIVYPDSPRSPLNVPLYFELQGASGGGFDGDPGDGCWQSAETLGRFLVERKDVEAIERAARKAFEDLAAKPAPKSAVRFAPEPEKLPEVGARGRRLLEALDRSSSP